mgnify:CR=1 FL=1
MTLYKRTDESCFKDIKNFDYMCHFISNIVDISDKYSDFRIAYVDENTKGKSGTIVCIHGHPTWSYLWRHLIPIAIKADFRVIALDLPGFGRSDKPLKEEFFEFNNYRKILLKFIDKLKLENIFLFLHEWGGTLGLTLPMENARVFSGLVCFSAYMGNNITSVSQSYLNWISTNIESEELNIRALMARTNRILNLSECNAYEAPFPDATFKTAIKMLPNMFPIYKDDEANNICIAAENWWKENSLSKCIMIGSGRDPLIPLEKMKLLSRLISTDGETHVISNAGHFIPEWGMEFGEELINQLKEN